MYLHDMLDFVKVGEWLFCGLLPLPLFASCASLCARIQGVGQYSTVWPTLPALPAFTFSQIDVEGAEAHVFDGMQGLIERFPNVVIVMEANTIRMGIEKAEVFYKAIFKVGQQGERDGM